MMFGTARGGWLHQRGNQRSAAMLLRWKTVIADDFECALQIATTSSSV